MNHIISCCRLCFCGKVIAWAIVYVQQSLHSMSIENSSWKANAHAQTSSSVYIASCFLYISYRNLLTLDCIHRNVHV